MLYVIDSLAPGGAETSLAAMAPLLVAGGVRLDVAYFKEVPGVHDRLRAAGAGVEHLGGQGRPGMGRFGTGRLGRIMAVRSLVRERRPDVVHTTLFEADAAGRVGAFLARTPVVSSLVNTPYGPEHRAAVPSAAKLRAAHLLDAVTARTVRRFHANSHDTAAVMARRLAVRPSKIDVVHRGRSAVSLGRRSPQRRHDVRATLSIDDTTPVVLAIGRHDHAKGLDILIRSVPAVLRRHPGAIVLVAGRDGPHTAHLHWLIEGLGEHEAAAIRLLGNRDDVADLLAAADVLAFPSRKEGLPGTLIEALALECRIVASDIAATREVLGDNSSAYARLVPSDDVDALATALIAALGTIDVAERSGNSAERRRFEEHFTIEQSVDGMLAFYRRALKRRPQAR